MRLLPLLIIALAHVPLLIVYFQQLWDRPHYQFFPMVLGAAAYFTWQRWPLRQPVPRSRMLLSHLILAMCAVLLTMSFLRLSPIFAYVSFVLVCAVALLRTGVPAWGPWLLLWVVVRVPYGQDVALIQWMQRLTTELSSAALETIGIEHIADGNVLLFPTTSLFVEEACSGVVSLLAIVACAGILAVWSRRSITHSLLLLGAGVFLAGAMNVVRIVVIAIALDDFGVNLTDGWRHETLGLCIFAVSLLGLLSIDRFLYFFLGPIEVSPVAEFWEAAEGNILVQIWNRYVGLDEAGLQEHVEPDSVLSEPTRSGRPTLPRLWDWSLAAVFVLLGSGQVIAGIGPFSVAPDISQVVMDLEEESLPLMAQGWRRVGFDALERDSSSAFGEHSRIWAFQNGPLAVRVSVDFVFPEWHALTACYQGVGWTLERDIRQRPTGEREFVEATFHKPNGEWALLLFDLFDDEGQPYQAPAGSFVHPKLRRVFSGQSSRWTLPNYYQVQILSLTEAEELSPDERESVRDFFVWFRHRMIEVASSPSQAQEDASTAVVGNQPATDEALSRPTR